MKKLSFFFTFIFYICFYNWNSYVDKITDGEINYKYNLLLENRSIDIWSYNVETIIAEKYKSIIKRNILNITHTYFNILEDKIWNI